MMDATKPVTDLVPGDQVPVTRTVSKVERTASTISVTFDDGTTAAYDLSAGTDPVVTVSLT